MQKTKGLLQNLSSPLCWSVCDSGVKNSWCEPPGGPLVPVEEEMHAGVPRGAADACSELRWGTVLGTGFGTVV